MDADSELVVDSTFDFEPEDGKVKFGNNRGNGYSNGHRTFIWNCPQGHTFKLTFAIIDFAGVATPTDPWPFRDAPAEPPSSTGWMSTEFKGKAERDGAYKYTVEIRDAAGATVGIEDPMIIVGR